MVYVINMYVRAYVCMHASMYMYAEYRTLQFLKKKTCFAKATAPIISQLKVIIIPLGEEAWECTGLFQVFRVGAAGF